MSDSTASSPNESGPLSLWDSVSLIIGIVIGSSIYKTPGLIFSNVADPWTGLALWVLCGGLSLASALCYSELATTYPRSGGEYNYLTRAFGAWAGFLFGWAQLAIIQTGSIGALSYVFAEYATDLFHTSEESTVWFAIGAVTSLTVLNMLGVNAGRHTQKVLVVAKLLGLLLLIVAGLSVNSPSSVCRDQTNSGTGLVAGDDPGFVCLWGLERCRVCHGRGSRSIAQYPPLTDVGTGTDRTAVRAGQSGLPASARI